MNPEEDLLTYAEAGALLRIAPRTVRRWVREGAIAAIKIGSNRYIERREVHEYLARQRSAANRERAAAAKAHKRTTAA